MPRCSHIPEKVEKNCTSWTVENFQQNSPAKTLGHAFLFISVLVSDHLMAKLRPRVPQHALPVHRLRHQCCLTRLVNAGDWPRKAKKKYIYIYIYVYIYYIYMVNHNLSPTLNLNEDLFLGGFPIWTFLYLGGRVKSLRFKLYSTQTFMDAKRSPGWFIVNLKSPSEGKLFGMLVPDINGS